MVASHSTRVPDESAEGPRGVIDTIGLGFALLNRRPYLIWVPVLLDVLLWLGGQPMAIAPLSVIGERADSVSGLYERTGDVELMHAMSSVVPTYLTHPSVDVPAVRAGDQIWMFNGVDGLVLSIGAIAIAILAAALHLTIVGRLVSDAPAATGRLPGDCLATGVRAMGLVAIMAAIMLFMMTPVGLVSAGLWVFGVDPTALVVLSLVTLGGWLGFFFVFAIPALAIGYQRLFSALRSSYSIVRHHAPGVIGLLAIVFVIHLGMPHALTIFSRSAWSIPFAIIVHAYIVTGLLASVLLFFQHRDSGSRSISRGPAPVTGT